MVFSGSPEQRTKVLGSLDPAKRREVLASMAPSRLPVGPIFKRRPRKPAKPDRNNRSAARQHGQLADLFAFLDPAKPQQVAAALPPDALAAFPEMRRLGLRLRQPQQVLSGDLREAGVFRAIYSHRQLEERLVDFWFNHFNVYDAKSRHSEDRRFLQVAFSVAAIDVAAWFCSIFLRSYPWRSNAGLMLTVAAVAVSVFLLRIPGITATVAGSCVITVAAA